MREVIALATLALSACDLVISPPASQGVSVSEPVDRRARAGTDALGASDLDMPEPPTTGFVHIAAEGMREHLYVVCALDGTGDVYCARALTQQLEHVPQLGHAQAISISWDEICAMSERGEVSCVERYRLGDLRHPATDAVALRGGGFRSCALLRGGALTCWRGHPDSEPEGVVLDDVRDFRVAGHVLARSGRGLLCLGFGNTLLSANSHGQCTDAPEGEGGARVLSMPTAIDLAAGDLTSCTLRDDGIWCWGHVDEPECDSDCGWALESAAQRCRRPEPRLISAMPADDPYVRIEGGRELLCASTRGGALRCGAIPSGTLRHVVSGARDFAVAGATLCYVASEGTLHCQREGEPLTWVLTRPEPSGELDASEERGEASGS